MKFSIPIAILILAAAAGIGWNEKQRLAIAQQKHAKLVAEAAGLGIALDRSHPSDPIHITKHERANREAEAKLAAKEFIAFAKEMEAIQKSGGPSGEATQKRMMEFMDRMMSLDAGQLKIVIAELRAATDHKDETRQELIGFSMMTLANDHPQAALALFTESSDLFNSDLFKKDGMGEHVISSSLSRWAKEDPEAAVAWLRENGKKFPELITDDAKRGLVAGAAVNDPKLAFKLIGELGLKDPNQGISGIITAAKTPEERTATLDALRDHLKTITDEKSRDETQNWTIGVLAAQVAGDGFEAATRWVAQANLSTSELNQFADGLDFTRDYPATAQWVEWLGENLPGKSDNKIQILVKRWTQNDYQAAGKWLGTTPAGPAKNVSVRSYAETISKYEPEAAAQWAMTLPAGKDRDSTLRQIYQNWPKEDPGAEAAAAAFAKEHGIK